MFNIKKLAILPALALLAVVPVIAAPAQKTMPAQKAKITTPALQSHTQVVQAVKVLPIELVQNPQKYLNKKIIMDAKFDKFSTLGLDYKKAFKDSAKYIGFLVKRDDVSDHNVPLSELKLFVKREYAEKFVDLNTGDKISISGTVFSTALGDPWVDITSIQILEKTKTQKNSN